MAEKNRLGHDPLAWMAEEEKQPPVETTPVSEQVAEEVSPVAEKETAITLFLTDSKRKNEEWITVSLPPLLTLSNLTVLQEQLQAHLGERVQLSGAQVERVDTAAMQLLLAFKNLPNTAVRWVAPSPKLCKAAHLLGLVQELGLPAKKNTHK